MKGHPFESWFRLPSVSFVASGNAFVASVVEAEIINPPPNFYTNVTDNQIAKKHIENLFNLLYK